MNDFQRINFIKIDRAVSYIKQHLFENINLKEVADNSYSSLYHFHRLFRQTTGLSLKEYIRKERMKSALYQLITTDTSVLNIALDQNYASPEPFNRQFKKQFGLTPLSLRKNCTSIELVEDISLHKTFQNRDDIIIKKPRIFVRKPMKCAGYTFRTSSDAGHNLKEGPEIWRDFWKGNRGSRIADQLNPDVWFGVVSNWSDNSWDYTICSEVSRFDNQPEDVACFTIPAQQYLIFETNGLAPSIMDTWNDAADFLSGSEYQTLPTYQIECYGTYWPEELFMPVWDFNNDPGYWVPTLTRSDYTTTMGYRMHIWLPVEHIHASQLTPHHSYK